MVLSVLICVDDSALTRELETAVDAAGDTYVSLTSFEDVLASQDRLRFEGVFIAWPDSTLGALRGALSAHGEEPPVFVAVCRTPGEGRDALDAGADDILLLPITKPAVAARLRVLERRKAARTARRADVESLEGRLRSHRDLFTALPDQVWKVEDGLHPVTVIDREQDEPSSSIEAAGHHLFEQTQEDGEPREFSVEATDASGNEAHYDVRVRRADSGDVFAFARDAATPTGALRALERAHDDFKTVIEAAPHGVLLHEDTRVVYLNQRSAEIIGLERDALLGQPAIAFLHPDDQQAALERVRRYMQTQLPPEPREYRALRADGEIRIVEVTPGPLVEFENRKVAVLMLRDLTETRRMMAKLSLASRMASIGTLAAGVAHELNNPLSFVITNLTVLREELAQLQGAVDPSAVTEVDEILTDIDTGALRIRDIVRDLSTWSDERANPDTTVDLSEAVVQCLRLLGSKLGGVRIHRDLATHLPVVAIPGRISQIVTNLLVNAAHAVREVEHERRIVTVRTHLEGNGFATLSISDQGPGMPESVTGRIFEPFFTTKRAGEGTGLGLWICHSLVEQMGGTIEVVSNLGRGTTVRVSIPTAPQPDGEGRYLVADDEPALGRALARMLPGRVTVVNSGAELLERIDDAEWDAVLCDYHMPDLDGVGVYEALSETAPAAAERFVLLVPAQEPAPIAAGPPRKLTKPFDRSRLNAFLAEIEDEE